MKFLVPTTQLKKQNLTNLAKPLTLSCLLPPPEMATVNSVLTTSYSRSLPNRCIFVSCISGHTAYLFLQFAFVHSTLYL